MERFLTATTKAEAAILTFAVEVLRYATSPSHSLLSSSPGEAVFGIILLSFTDQVLSVAWRPYLFIYLVSPNSRVEGVLSSFYSHLC